MAVGRAGRATPPADTRETLRDSGEIVREFDLRSATAVLGAAIGAVFLVFFLAAFVPWLLANGMTAAVEGMMHQVGFDDFSANTLGDWILVLFIGAVFTAFIVAVCVAILLLYNVLSQRTGMGLRVVTELPLSEERAAIETPAARRERSSGQEAGRGREAQGREQAVESDEVVVAAPRTAAMRRLRRHPVLVVVTVGLATLEALLVVAVGPADRGSHSRRRSLRRRRSGCSTTCDGCSCTTRHGWCSWSARSR